MNTGDAAIYTCPMHPEVRQPGPGTCPDCGMALEPELPMTTRTEYTCPMHPEVVRDGPGECPICGMALESRTISVDEEANPELAYMSRRFWISLVLTVPLLLIAMGDMLFGDAVAAIIPMRLSLWVQLVLATPVVLWGGWPFFVRGWNSLVTRHLNMFTLIAMGTGVAYVFSAAVTLFHGVLPDALRGEGGTINVYFEDKATDVWFEPSLLQFVDHGEGAEIELDGVTKKWVRSEDGGWIEHSTSARHSKNRAWWTIW